MTVAIAAPAQRSYRLGKRAEDMAATRERVLNAARSQLAKDPARFSLETVATASGVARLTVYRHFGSRAALLRAVIATMADEAGVRATVRNAIETSDRTVAIGRFVDSAINVWEREPALTRAAVSLRGDPEVGEVTTAADTSRYRDARALAARTPSPLGTSDLARALTLLTAPDAYLFLVDQLGLSSSRARGLLRKFADQLIEGE